MSSYKIGMFQELQVVREVPMGVYLTIPNNEAQHEDTAHTPSERILLPKKEVPEGTCINEIINVFVYKYS